MPHTNNFDHCQLCGHTSFTKLFSATDFDSGEVPFTLMECTHCHLVCTNPILTQNELGQYYNQEYYGSAAKKFTGLIERWTQFNYQRRARNILKLVSTNKADGKRLSILDIGCGRAHLLEALANSGCDCVGVERGEFPPRTSKNLKIFNEDFSHINFDDQKFDVIILWHVLEHLTTPSQTIEKISQILNPDGTLLLAVPNFGSFQAKFFRKYWFHLDLPRHTYHFTYSTLHQLLDKYNLTIRNSDSWEFDQSIFGFIQSGINATSLFTPNDLYHHLKHKRYNRLSASSLVQFLLVFLLSPFALLEYCIGGLVGNGSCINLQVIRKP